MPHRQPDPRHRHGAGALLWAHRSARGGHRPGDYRLNLKRGGGAMLDVGCYPLTAAAWATRAAPLYLSETKVSRAKSGVDLTVDCALGSRRGETNGRVGVLVAFALPEHQSLRIDGDGGSVDFIGGDAFTNYRQPASLAIIDETSPGLTSAGLSASGGTPTPPAAARFARQFSDESRGRRERAPQGAAQRRRSEGVRPRRALHVSDWLSVAIAPGW